MRHKSKNAQLKIQQMAFMLIAITLFFVIVGLFVLKIRLSGLESSVNVLEERNALLLVTRLSNSPEFSCGEAFGNARTNCIDSDKVMMLKSMDAKYAGFWGVENIEIRRIYPSVKGDVECTLANYPDCGIMRIHEGRISSEHSNFVSLCRKEFSEERKRVENRCEIAKLMVGYEKRGE
jgi:hypothetical protein